MALKNILIFILIFLCSCTVQKNQKPNILITHVLAITEQGDTLMLPINMIKPNVYYNIINYGNDYYRPHSRWYNNYWYLNQNPAQRPIYAPSNSNNNTNNNTNNNIQIKPPTNPPNRPTEGVLKKKNN